MEGEEREAREIAEHFASLAHAAPPPPGGEHAELETTSALLAWTLPPERPRPESRARLLAALPPAAAAARPALAPPAPVVELAAYARRERRAWGVVRLLAAALAICLVGSAVLVGQLRRQGAQLSAQAALAAQLERQDALHTAELDVAGRRLHMVTSVARYAYRLQSVAAPAAAVPAAGAAGHPPQGMVYVCGHHQQWILSLEHLAPPPPGRAYHVQFRTAGGVVDGGILRVGADARAGMEDVKLPPGTTGFSVTLEPEDSAGDPLLVLESQPGVPL